MGRLSESPYIMGHMLNNKKHHVILITTDSQLQTWAWLERRKLSLVSGILGLGLVLFTALLVVKICLMFQIEELTSKAEISDGVGVEKRLSLTCPYDTGLPAWTKSCSWDGMTGCTNEVRDCIKYDGCAHILWQFQELWRVGRC